MHKNKNRVATMRTIATAIRESMIADMFPEDSPEPAALKMESSTVEACPSELVELEVPPGPSPVAITRGWGAGVSIVMVVADTPLVWSSSVLPGACMSIDSEPWCKTALGP